MLLGLTSECATALLKSYGSQLGQGSSLIMHCPMRAESTSYTAAYAKTAISKLFKSYVRNKPLSAVTLVLRDLPGKDEFTALERNSTFKVSFEFESDSKLSGRFRGQRLALLFRRVQAARNEARAALRVLKDEINSNANRTPFLLPLRSFHSKSFLTWLEDANTSMVSAQDKQVEVKRLRAKFESHHPFLRPGKGKKGCYVDRSNRCFWSPGKARHGAPGAGKGHPPLCVISARHRLGATYDEHFHFDCTARKGQISGEFPNCHGDALHVPSTTHINIAPNDFVRMKQGQN